MGAVLVHGEQVPGDARHLAIEVFDEGGSFDRGHHLRAVAVIQIGHLTQIGFVRLDCREQLDQRHEPLAAGNEIGVFFP